MMQSVEEQPATLCVLMPVYNERYRIMESVRQVLEAPLPDGVQMSMVIVDDGSTDGTRDRLREIETLYAEKVRVIYHQVNQGKGAAIRTALQAAEGDFALIQDADLEYDPGDYPALLAPLLTGDADVVYGSRFAAGPCRRVLYFWHTMVNQVLTLASNMATDLNLTDMETGYKAFRLELLKSVPLRCDRFGLEPEFTAKVAKRGFIVYEVPISYRGRTYREGKKIGAWDGVKALGIILKYWLMDDLYEEKYGHAILHRLSATHRFNRWMADTLRPYVGEKVLEIGSGIGNLSAQFLPRESYTCSDIDPLHLRFLQNRYGQQPNVNIKQVNLTAPENFKPLHGQYDTVVCLNVLEHVEDHETGLKNIYDALQPGGRALILVPRGNWLFGSLDRVLGHWRRYTPTTLRAVAEKTGFEIDRIFDFNRIAVPAWFLNARILQRTYFGRIQLKIFDSLVPLWRMLDRVLPWHGISVIGVLRKPKTAAKTVPASRAA